MVVAPTDAETLERALSRVAESFRVVERLGPPRDPGRPSSTRTRRGLGRRHVADHSGVPAREPGRPAVPGRHGLRFPACRAPWPTASARSRSSRRWPEAGSWESSARPVFRSPAIEHALDRIEQSLGESLPFGMNLIHSPGEPDLESAVVDLYLRRRRAAGRGFGVPEPDAAGRPLSRRGNHAATAPGGSSRPIESSPRSRGSKSPRSSWRRRPSHSSASWSLPARSRPSRPSWAAAHSDGRRRHRRGRFGRPHRQPAGHRAAADDARAARADASPARATRRPPRVGRRRRNLHPLVGGRARSPWGQPTS